MTANIELPSDTAAPTSTTSVPYTLTRIGVLMTPNPDDAHEAEGVLNPATAWGPDGELYLFPRLVADGNVSRVGRGRVVLADGVPTAVERLGVVLGPSRGWEHGTAHGGTEDPRITFIPSLGMHVMTYVAFGPLGPVPAIAISNDTETWQRLGPIRFGYEDTLDTDLSLFPNKDVLLFPEVVPDPDGTPSYAMLHRPMWDLSFARPGEAPPLPVGTTDERPGIWISYVPAADVLADIRALTRPWGHRPVALARESWESLKIGAGPSPLRVPEGWLVLYHGVSGELDGSAFVPQGGLTYSAGAMILDADDPSRVLARTDHPLLVPSTDDERHGIAANVVFPTAIEEIDGQLYVFYGMADSRIGVALLERSS
jgi:beta-1,2-mannobiose phosphorylase / 1,2-beta-oligomannan phosphorylase